MSFERRRWRPTPLLASSLGLHLAALGGVAAIPRLWPWALTAMAIDQLALAAIGSWPRSRLLGPNLRRLGRRRIAAGEVALTFDDGPDPEVTPRVLELLAERGAGATFFFVGRRARRYPEVVRATADAGHAIANHTENHRYAFGFYGPRRAAREIDRAQSVLCDLAGSSVQPFFRPPAGARGPLLEPLLARRGLRLTSWTRRGLDGVVSDPDRVLRRLRRRLAAGDLLLLHDGAFGRRGRERAVLEVLPRLLDELRERGLSSVALDAGDAVCERPPRAASLPPP